MDGFWDNTPDLDLPEPRKRKKPADPGVVIYHRIKCPKCNSDKVPVYDSSHIPVRYHKCADCGHSFKSVEAKK